MTKSASEQRKELFQRIFELECEVLDAQEIQKEVKADYTYCKDTNVNGLEKEDVAKIIKAAKAHAKQVNMKEKIEELSELDSIVEELS